MSRCVLITGATGSIGSALAEHYAEKGNTLILQGRKEELLLNLVALCEAKGASVLTKKLDLTDHQALVDWLHTLSGKILPDLVIINAGMNTNIGPNNEAERWDTVNQLLDVNLISAMITVDALLPALRRRGSGQIALISSLAAWFGLPVTPSYCASKAALKVYGEALRGWLAPEGIQINVIMPGYVESDLSEAMPGPKPFLWAPTKAARKIRRGLEKNQARISFPFPLTLGTWFLSMLPVDWSLRILRWLGYCG